jgi:hypothetical protein
MIEAEADEIAFQIKVLVLAMGLRKGRYPDIADMVPVILETANEWEAKHERQADDRQP